MPADKPAIFLVFKKKKKINKGLAVNVSVVKFNLFELYTLRSFLVVFLNNFGLKSDCFGTFWESSKSFIILVRFSFQSIALYMGRVKLTGETLFWDFLLGVLQDL